MRSGSHRPGKVFVIAEIGDNHNGKVALAKKLIRQAAGAGADAVKFQTWITEEVFTKDAPKARYHKKSTDASKSLFEVNKELELTLAEHRELQRYARRLGVVFFSKAGSPTAVGMLARLGVPLIKIGSPDLTNIPLLRQAAATRIPLILSTGMGTIAEVREAVGAIRAVSRAGLSLMHCTSTYPALFEDVNLNALVTLRKAFGLPVGYSDHTEGFEVAVAAVALGARLIEKHLTLDKGMEGPDHAASAEPDEFGEMVRAIRNIERALGDGTKRPVPHEREIIEKMRKSVVAAADIRAGERIAASQVACKRPGTGLEPRHLPYFIGKKAKRDIRQDSFMRFEYV